MIINNKYSFRCACFISFIRIARTSVKFTTNLQPVRVHFHSSSVKWKRRPIYHCLTCTCYSALHKLTKFCHLVLKNSQVCDFPIETGKVFHNSIALVDSLER